MDEHDEHDFEDVDQNPWMVWRDAGSAYVEWTDLPITLFKVVEEVGNTVARLGGFACELFKAHANERSRRKYVRSEMVTELERIVGGE